MKDNLFVDSWSSFLADHSLSSEGDDENDSDVCTLTLSVLKDYQCRASSPLQTLQHYYQSIGYSGSIADCWIEPARFYRIGTSKEAKTYWKCVFRCPLNTASRMTTATSVLPRILLQRYCGDKDKNNIGDRPSFGGDNKLTELEQLTRDYLGTFVVCPAGVVFFKNKKQAQKCAAFAMLYKLYGEQGIPNDIFGSEKSKRKKKKDIFFQPSSNSDVSVHPKKLEKKRRKLSNIPWIHRLHDVGIRKVHIVYRGCHNYDHDDDASGTTKPHLPPILSPTLVICEMEIRDPIPLTITSPPMSTKAMARDEAVSQLIAGVSKQFNKNGKGGLATENDTPDVSSFDMHDYLFLDELEQLLNCDSPYISNKINLPYWTRWDASSTDDKEMVLYELVLACDRHDTSPTLISKKFNLKMHHVTRIGLLLPICDDLIDHSSRFAEFESSFRFAGDDDTIYSAQLRNPQQIHLSRNCDRSVPQIQHLLEKFRLISTHWKLYGTNCPLEALRDRDTVTATKNSRRYTFVPLCSRPEDTHKIDWDLMERVVQGEAVPFLSATPRYSRLFVVFAAICYVVFAGAMNLYQKDIRNWTRHVDTPRLDFSVLLSWKLLIFFISLVLGMWRFLSYKYEMKVEDLSNCFLHYRPIKNCVYIASQSPIHPQLNAYSMVTGTNDAFPLLCRQSMDTDSISSNITFVNLLWKRHRIRLRHPKLNMVIAQRASKISEFNDLRKRDKEVNQMPGKFQFLAPELVRILPMPQDFLFAVGLAEMYVIPLETRILEQSRARKLINRANQIGTGVLKGEDRRQNGSSSCEQSNKSSLSLNNLLTEATTVFPVNRFERLEFLGDRVLNHFIMLNMFYRNGSLQWDHDQLKKNLTVAKKNSTLEEGALRAGLDTLVHAGIIPWKEGHTSVAIPDAFLSNIAESILAAVYLYAITQVEKIDVAQAVVGILECMCPPLPAVSKSKRDNFWFLGPSTGLRHCHDLQGHPQWRKCLEEASSAFESLPANIRFKLENNACRLKAFLLENVRQCERVNIEAHLDSDCSSILILIALFDANLDGSDDGLCCLRMENLEKLGVIRDNLFFIGYTALELELSRDLFLLNPDATPGDLHLLSTCILTHDVLAYVLFRNGMHGFLFDENAPGVRETMQTMASADIIGEKEWWQPNGGWILPGGVKTYIRRRDKLRTLLGSGPPISIKPNYPGVVGGRLFGNSKKSGMAVIDEWQFSFKCIFGFLVISLGNEAAWQKIFRPFLEELMLMTAEEHRHFFTGVSSICESYEKGKENSFDATRKIT